MSFLDFVRKENAKNNDKFRDDAGREWIFVSDGTASAIQCSPDGKTKIRLTQEQMEVCLPPLGFKKLLTPEEETLLAVAEMAELQERMKAAVSRLEFNLLMKGQNNGAK